MRIASLESNDLAFYLLSPFLRGAAADEAALTTTLDTSGTKRLICNMD
jgi:hypothetical protein